MCNKIKKTIKKNTINYICMHIFMLQWSSSKTKDLSEKNIVIIFHCVLAVIVT